jgi:hypothetical protein
VIIARRKILGAKCGDVRRELLYLLAKASRHRDGGPQGNKRQVEPMR